MKIGKLSLATVERKAGEVEVDLLRMTGVAVHEMHVMLAYPQLAGTVAAALLPLLVEPFERHALAEAIQAEGVHEVRAQVRALYDAMLTTKEAPSGKGKA